MKTSRISSVVVATLALFASGYAHAAPGDTVVLNTVHKLWVNADDIGPKENGLPRVGQNTGAGIMDANFAYDQTAAAKAAFGETVLIGSTYTRSSNTRNNDNSYMQGGFVLGKINATTGVELGQKIDLPQLNGERAFMRPLIQFTPKYVVLIAASEDNNSNNGNPKPVMFIASKADGKLVQIANSTRGTNINKPTDLMRTAVQQGINVNNENNQRGPHMIVPITDTSFLVGMQYNNQAQEAFRVTIDESGPQPRVQMNWVRRYSNNAVHNRPQVAYTPGAKEGYLTALECNNQPGDIGIRVVKLNIDTGAAILDKRVIQAIPNQNKYVAEPSIADLGDKIAIGWARSAKARNRNGANGHAGGSNVSQLSLFSKADLSRIGEDLVAPANYQRHAHIFATHYGPANELAVGVISGSSTGTSKGLLQVIPLKTDGTLGLKDPLKMYPVSTYSDVANLQARGKRNPNNQAKGFINGLGDVPNPGYQKAGGFYPEVKAFSMSTVTGYSGQTARDVGRRESLWLSLVPAVWDPALKTTPGAPSENAGTGPAPRTADPATDPSGASAADDGSSVIGGEATNPGEGGGRNRAMLGEDNGGCSTSNGTRSSGFGLVALAALGVVAAIRRRKTGEA